MPARNRLHHLGNFHDIEVFEANEIRGSYGKHAHDTFAIGAITHGVGGYWCRGSTHTLPQQTLSLMNPEELHTGYEVADALQYRMLYVPEAAVTAILGFQVRHGFGDISPEDVGGRITQDLSRLANLLAGRERIPGYRMLVEEMLTRVLAEVFARHARQLPRKPGREPDAIRRAVEIIDAHVQHRATEKLGIAELAARVGLHPNYFIRSFGRARGLSPHAWLIHRKLCMARQMLTAGTPALDTALALGFHDQAHFIRHFRKVFGASPGNIIVHSWGKPRISHRRSDYP